MTLLIVIYIVLGLLSSVAIHALMLPMDARKRKQANKNSATHPVPPGQASADLEVKTGTR